MFSTDNALNSIGPITNGAGDLKVGALTLSGVRRVFLTNSAATFTSTGAIGLPADSTADASYVAGAGIWRLRSTNSSLSNPDIIYSPSGTGSSYGAQITSTLDTGTAGTTHYIVGYANNNQFYDYWGYLQIGRNATMLTGGSLTGAGNLYFYGYPSSSWNMDFVLMGNNSAFTGSVTLQRGYLTLYNGSALTAANSVLLNPNAGETAILQPWATYFTNLNIGALASSGAGTPEVLAHYNQTLTINQNTDSTFSGVIASDSGILSVAKSGTGTLALSGANTYSGTTTISTTTNPGGVTRAGIAQNGTTSGPFGKASEAGSIVFGGNFLQYSSANQTDYSPRFSTAASQAYKIDVNGQSVTFATVLSSSGGTLTLADTAGGGKLTLSGANTYTGATTVSSGTLQVDGAIASGAVAVQSGGTLDGAGVIAGPVMVNSGGTLNAGDLSGPGMLTISNALTLNPGSATMMRLNQAAATNDSVSGITMLTCGGTLTVTNLGGTLAAGNSFQLFNAATYAGSFSATNLPALGAGLAWNWLPTNGTLAVISTALPAPKITGFSHLADGWFSLTFSGSPGADYSVYATTNLALPISNWMVLTTGSFNGAPVPFQDTNATKYKARFYEVVLP